METSKFASVMARAYIRQQTQKRLFGKPYIRHGPLLTVCGFLFQQSSLLGRAFRSIPEPFVMAFCAPEDRSEDVIALMRQEASKRFLPYLDRVRSVNELVLTCERNKTDDPDDPYIWFSKRAMARLSVDAAAGLAWFWQLDGASFGMEHPDRFEELFNNSYKKDDAENWRQAYAHGVVDTPEQPEITIDQAQGEAIEAFSEYCKEFYPQLLYPLGLAE